MALVDVVEWKNKKDEILYRFPGGGVSAGAQLNVTEGQEAIIFMEGRALDGFGPGRHSLKAGNVPLFEEAAGIAAAGTSPFPAEIYYVNREGVQNLKWGTEREVVLTDAVFAIDVPIRAFGSFAIKIGDPKTFLAAAAGAWHAADTESAAAALRDNIILPKLKDIITGVMADDAITILKLASRYDRIGKSGKTKLQDEFARCGIELLGFAVESIAVPQEDESVQKLRKALVDGEGAAAGGEDAGRLERTIATMEKAPGNSAPPAAGDEAGTARQEPAAKDHAGTAACPYCSAQNPGGAKYCMSCGKELAELKHCPRCSAKAPANAKFCSECGASLTPGTCVNCGFTIGPGMKYCPECGTRQG